MTATARPPTTRSIRIVYGVLLREQIRPGRLLGLAALVAIALLLGVAAANVEGPVEAGVDVVGTFGLGVVVPVAALLVGSSALGDQVDDRTLVYLLLRPVPRWAVAVAAVAAATTIGVPLSVAAGLAVGVLVGDGGLIVGAALSSLLGAAAYCGLFTWLGLVARRALVWGLAYILIWEGFVASAGSGLARLAIRSWTRSILSSTTEVDLRLADRSPAVSVVVCVLVAVAGVAATTWVLDRREIE